MIFAYFILALSVSVDSLGIGITYGFRNIKLTNLSKAILFFISISITSFSVYIGNIINNIIPSNITVFFSALLLFFIGLFVIYHSLKHEQISFDFDNSKKIDLKEATCLSIALSIDAIGVSICSSIIGYNSFLFPLLVACFQLLFILIGNFLGRKASSISNVPQNIWNVLSGLLLICIGISKLFI